MRFARVAVLAFAALAGAGAGCASSTVEVAAPLPVASTRLVEVRDACRLVSRAQAETMVGPLVEDPTPLVDSAGPAGAQESRPACAYLADGSTVTLTVYRLGDWAELQRRLTSDDPTILDDLIIVEAASYSAAYLRIEDQNVIVSASAPSQSLSAVLGFVEAAESAVLRAATRRAGPPGPTGSTGPTELAVG